MGFVVPSVRLRDSAALNANQYVIKLKGQYIGSATTIPGATHIVEYLLDSDSFQSQSQQKYGRRAVFEDFEAYKVEYEDWLQNRSRDGFWKNFQWSKNILTENRMLLKVSKRQKITCRLEATSDDVKRYHDWVKQIKK
jgi:hypothetical protein